MTIFLNVSNIGYLALASVAFELMLLEVQATQ